MARARCPFCSITLLDSQALRTSLVSNTKPWVRRVRQAPKQAQEKNREPTEMNISPELLLNGGWGSGRVARQKPGCCVLVGWNLATSHQCCAHFDIQATRFQHGSGLEGLEEKQHADSSWLERAWKNLAMNIQLEASDRRRGGR